MTARRVVLTGSESTGKSTMALALARHYGTIALPEFARQYMDAKGSALDADDVEPIVRGQLASEEMALGSAKRILIQDTDVVSTMVYARHYNGRCPSWIVEAASIHRASLYLLSDIDVPWVADPQRDRGHMRAEMHALFVAALREIGARVVLIRGEWSARQGAAIAAIDSLLKRD